MSTVSGSGDRSTGASRRGAHVGEGARIGRRAGAQGMARCACLSPGERRWRGRVYHGWAIGAEGDRCPKGECCGASPPRAGGRGSPAAIAKSMVFMSCPQLTHYAGMVLSSLSIGARLPRPSSGHRQSRNRLTKWSKKPRRRPRAEEAFCGKECGPFGSRGTPSGNRQRLARPRAASAESWLAAARRREPRLRLARFRGVCAQEARSARSQATMTARE